MKHEEPSETREGLSHDVRKVVLGGLGNTITESIPDDNDNNNIEPPRCTGDGSGRGGGHARSPTPGTGDKYV